MTKYEPVKCPKKIVIFRSLLELGYALSLDQDPKIKSWDYEVMWTYYMDGFTGKQRRYICDFRVEYHNDLVHDGNIEYKEKKIVHIEVKPLRLQTYEDKYLYAKNVIPNWRFISEEEISLCEKLLDTADLSRVFVPVKIYERQKKFVVWSKEDSIDLPDGYRVFQKRKKFQFYQFRVVNDKFVEPKKKRVKLERPKNLHGKDLDLDQDEILELVKQDKSAKEIGDIFNCNYRTIIKFLEDRSYVVYWNRNASKHNEIYLATKKIWPPEDLPPRQAKRDRKDYFWDDKEWLQEHYWDKGLSFRQIGELVGVSNRLVAKKMKKHGISSRSVGESVSLRMSQTIEES